MAKQDAFYNPFLRFEWVEYLEDGADPDATPFRAKIRSNLTFGELEALVWESEDADGNQLQARDAVWPMFAPYVVEWNLKTQDDKGKLVDIDPPSVGGPGQFEYIPTALFWELVMDIKLRSTGKIDPKRLSGRKPADDPTSSSATTKKAET